MDTSQWPPNDALERILHHTLQTPRVKLADFCERCQTFFGESPRARERWRMADEHLYPYNHCPSLQHLWTSALGCSLCALLVAHSIQYVNFDRDRLRAVRLKLEHPYREGEGLVLHIGLAVPQHHLVETVGYLYIQALNNEEHMTLASLGLATDSTGSFQLARSWLDKCISNHIQCQGRGQTSGQMPTRLVEVIDTDNARLILSATLPPDTPYITLSHCWGKERFKTLLQSNVKDLMVAIPVQDLPQTFADAIRITNALRYRFIWIDSLCIIQDSVTDWESEAASMASVYQNSDLTIAASASANAIEGCFRARSRSKLLLETNPFSDLNTSHLMITGMDSDDEPTPVEHTVLRSRGWILQEEILSRRMLHFADGQLFWECQCSWGYERRPLLTERREREVRSIFESNEAPVATQGFGFAPHNSSWDVYWATILRDFTARDLTKGTDKFIALAGIAKVVQEKLNNDDYLAGLWRHDLLLGMCWSSSWTFLKGKEHTRPDKYRAPTWSWASLDGRVTMKQFHTGRRDTVHYYSDLVDARTMLATNNPLGDVEGGWLRLKSVILSASVTLIATYRFQEGICTDFVTLDASTVPVWLQHRWKRCEQQVSMDLRPIELDGDQTSGVSLCPIYCTVTSDVDDLIYSSQTGLLLLTQTSATDYCKLAEDEACFRRVGFMTITDLGIAPDPFFEELFGRKCTLLV